MDISRQTMNDLFTTFKGTFSKGLGLAPDQYQKFSTVETSASASDTYPMAVLLSSMRKWTGDRQAQNVASLKLKVTNCPYENLISINKWDVLNDQIGHYGSAFQQLGQTAGKIWNDLAIDALLNPSTWMDDAAFFGTTRLYNGSTISNKDTGALTAATYATARATMLGYKGFDGKPIGVSPNLLIVGPSLEATAFSILKDRLQVSGATNKAAATDNPWQGSGEYIVLPELQGDYAAAWFLCDVRNVYKPVIVQKRQEPVVVRRDVATDDNVFYRQSIEYGVEANGAATLTMPHLIYRGGLA